MKGFQTIGPRKAKLFGSRQTLDKPQFEVGFDLANGDLASSLLYMASLFVLSVHG
jgi:hypothetical protein